MGACLDLIRHCAATLRIEANAVTDNPLLFVEQGDVLSGGNFHAEPVAFAADTLALAIAEIGNLSERRMAVLVDPKMSGLPAFLVENSGVNSGFMIAQVTAAALVAENKSTGRSLQRRLHPDLRQPGRPRQHGHPRRAPPGADGRQRRRRRSASNCSRPLRASTSTARRAHPHRSRRCMPPSAREVAHYAADRYFAPDIEAAKQLGENRPLLAAGRSGCCRLEPDSDESPRRPSVSCPSPARMLAWHPRAPRRTIESRHRELQ